MRRTIPEGHPQFQEVVNKKHTSVFESDVIFGAKEIRKLRNLETELEGLEGDEREERKDCLIREIVRDFYGHPQYMGGKFERVDFGILNKKKDFFRFLLKSQDQEVKTKIVETLTRVKERQKGFFTDSSDYLNIDPSHASEDEICEFFDRYELGWFEQDERMFFIEAYARIYEEQAMEFERKSEEFFASFKQRIFYVIEQGMLPISRDIVEQRLQQSHVVPLDPSHDTEEFAGSCNTVEGLIFIESFTENQDHIFDHEALHQISGRIIQGFFSDETDYNFFTLQKHGLALGGNFSWLDEAITEGLTLTLLRPIDEIKEGKMLDLKNGQVYKTERQLLDAMLESLKKLQEQKKEILPEISSLSLEHLLLQIYFQSPTKGDPKLWAQLSKAVDTLVGHRGVLKKIDRFMNSLIEDDENEDQGEGEEEDSLFLNDFIQLIREGKWDKALAFA